MTHTILNKIVLISLIYDLCSSRQKILHTFTCEHVKRTIVEARVLGITEVDTRVILLSSSNVHKASVKFYYHCL